MIVLTEITPYWKVSPQLTIITIALILVCILAAIYMARLAAARKRNLEEKSILHEELEASLEKAREANDAKNIFIAKVSHEIRTPLNAVIGLSSMTLDEEGLDKEVIISLERIYSSGMTIMSIVNDLLDLSKMEAGKYILVRREYDVPDMINDVISQNVIRIGSKPIEFILNIDENLPIALIGDELRVRQIFNNLLSNAFNFTREGLVELNIKCSVENDDFWLIVQVRDSGIGIPEEDLPKIFSYYFRGNTAADAAIQGTGLGLPITKMLVEMMDGSIIVESASGKGSTFTVKIKQRPATDEKISPEVIQTLKYFDYSNTKRRQYRNLEREPLAGAKILVVDDVQINIDVLKGFLKPYQIQIDYVTTGQQAIDVIREGKIKYNAIFMDHLLPDINGIDATRQIRSMDTEYAKNIPIIAFTANTLLGNEKMFLDAGSQDFISKPITLDKLDMVVQRWIGVEPSFEKPLGNKQSGLVWNNKIDGLDLPVALEHFGGDEELLFNTLRSFTDNVPDLVHKAALTEKSESSEYTAALHSIKGACRIIHAEDLARRAEELERASVSGDTRFITGKNDEFLSDVKKFVAGLKTLLAEIDPEVNM